MAIAIVATTFVGVSRTFFLQPWLDASPLPLAVHLHGLSATAFVLLFLVQTALIGQRRVALHRRLGTGTVVVAVLLFVSAFPAGIAMAHVRGDTDLAVARLAAPFVTAPVFIVLVAAAVVYRRRPQVHKCLMLFAAIEAVTPALGRLPILDAYLPASFFVTGILFLLAVLVHDWWTNGRVPAATVWGGGLVLASLPARFLLAGSDVWHAIGRHRSGGVLP